MTSSVSHVSGLTCQLSTRSHRLTGRPPYARHREQPLSRALDGATFRAKMAGANIGVS